MKVYKAAENGQIYQQLNLRLKKKKIQIMSQPKRTDSKSAGKGATQLASANITGGFKNFQTTTQ